MELRSINSITAKFFLKTDMLYKTICSALALSILCSCSDAFYYKGERIIWLVQKHDTKIISKGEADIRIRKIITAGAIYGYNIELQKGCILACREGDVRRPDDSQSDEPAACRISLANSSIPIFFTEVSATEKFSSPEWTVIPNYRQKHTVEIVIKGKELSVAHEQRRFQFDFTIERTEAGRAPIEICEKKKVSVLSVPRNHLLASLHMGPMLMFSQEGPPTRSEPNEFKPLPEDTCTTITPVLPEPRQSNPKLRCNRVSKIDEGT